MLSVSAVSQQSGDMQSSFEDFRRGLLDDFNNFRNDILADYAKFLDGVWVEYSGFKGQERNNTPKPELPPLVDPDSTPDTTPTKPGRSDDKPAVSPVKDTTPVALSNGGNDFTFSYYGIEMQIPDVDIRLMERLSKTKDFAEQWRMLDANPASEQLIKNISDLAKRHNFNDYLTYDLAARYAVAKYPNISPSSRTSLVHYIMTHLGFDARIGVNGSGQALLMLPCKQTVYGYMFLVFDNAKYYVFVDPQEKLSMSDTRISTCQLPKAAANASKIDLRLNPINIPYKAKTYSVSHDGVEIHGEVNENLFPIIYKYPQMPISDYAESELLPDLRRDVVAQLKAQLADKPTAEAVDALLQFVQSGFDYATDHQYHGFEKPYFFEEMLFYDKCDCEDRVVFYTYLLWNVLGVENHLLAYPGHESASVTIPGKTRGDAYNYDGKTFLISDPTYIGAKTGMCMPNFKSKTPEIDHIYR